jgi:hypothetical protein
MTNSLTGAILNFYASSPNNAKLQADVGDGFYTDEMPFNTLRPYIEIEQTGTHTYAECKAAGARGRIEDIMIAFNVYAKDRDTAEQILYDVEALFLNTTSRLTLDNYTHYTQYLENRVFAYDQYGWLGSCEIKYRLQNLQ